MNANEIVTVIQSIGFPIVMCGAMGWFVYFMYNKNRDDMETIRQTHSQETSELRTAIENNTLVMQKLIDKLDKGGEI